MAKEWCLAALAGKDLDDEAMEIEELKRQPRKSLSLKQKVEILIYDLMTNYGFFGILLCASVPILDSVPSKCAADML